MKVRSMHKGEVDKAGTSEQRGVCLEGHAMKSCKTAPELCNFACKDEEDGEAQQPGAMGHKSVQLTYEGHAEEQPRHR